MNRFMKMATIFVCVLLITVTPVVITAQTGQDFNPSTATGSIVPACTGAELGGGLTERECTFCDFMQLVRNILNFILFFAVLTAGVLFAYVGWLFVISEGNPSKRASAKKILTSAAVGLVLVLGAYTIVDTLMKTLAGGRFTTGWSEICPR